MRSACVTVNRNIFSVVNTKQYKNFTRRIEADRMMIDFVVVNSTDDDCKLHVPSVALRLQQLATPPTTMVALGRQQTRHVERQVEQYAHVLYLRPEYLHGGAFGEGLYAAATDL